MNLEMLSAQATELSSYKWPNLQHFSLKLWRHQQWIIICSSSDNFETNRIIVMCIE